MTDDKLEVFMELSVRTGSAKADVRAEVLRVVCAPWSHHKEREDEMREAVGDDVIVLGRTAIDEIPEVRLILFQDDLGYRVTNIVPTGSGELGVHRYNRIVKDFAEQIVEPAADAGGFEVILSPAYVTLHDLVGADAAQRLLSFSNMANKSTGASHPKDQERWFEFIIACHKNGKRIDGELLLRWFVEVASWWEESAMELAGEYERCLELLTRYDSHR